MFFQYCCLQQGTMFCCTLWPELEVCCWSLLRQRDAVVATGAGLATACWSGCWLMLWVLANRHRNECSAANFC